MMHLLKPWMDYREKQGLSQRAAAEKLGIDRNVIANWELGRSAPRKEAALKICAMLGVPYQETGTKRLVADVNCPSCRARVPGPEHGAMFCMCCGHPIARKCSGCGVTAHKEGAGFCWSCGTKLDGPNTGILAESERTETNETERDEGD